MRLRTRLLLAQAPLALALLLVGALAVATLREAGAAGGRILAENYRSTLAAQRMNEALERLDSAALFRVAGEDARAQAQEAEHLEAFGRELAVQQANITESGEAEATVALAEAWGGFQAALGALPAAADRRAAYFRTLQPRFVATKQALGRVLALNQGAMEAKSEALRRQSARANLLTLAGVGAALLAGVLASAHLTARAVRPLLALSAAARRVGAGDWEARVGGPDAGGEIGQLAGDFDAMAERLRAYRDSSLGELLQAQAASQAAIDSLPDPVVVLGLQGELLNANTAAERVLGLSVEREGGGLAALPPPVREVLARLRAHVLSGAGPYAPRGYDEALRLEGPEGPAFYVPRATAVEAGGAGVRGVTVVLQDVTRLRRFDELAHDQVAAAAHEFRTPLTSLRMAVSLCAEGVAGPTTAQQAELLGAAREDCERLQALVDDLLDLRRIQSGRLELTLRPVPVQDVLEAGVAPHRAAAEQKGVALEVHPAPGADAVQADPERLALALSNLVANAVRHTPAGGRVRVEARREGPRVRFRVEDTGPGVPAEHHKRIFEKFFRVPGAPPGAAGLGLTIAREVVDAHGGALVLEGPGGKGDGARFSFDVRAAER